MHIILIDKFSHTAPGNMGETTGSALHVSRLHHVVHAHQKHFSDNMVTIRALYI
jgi:hypothetical protein